MVQGQVGHVHSIEAENDVGQGQQDSERGQHLHDDVQVIGNHGGKRIHHT